MEYQTLELEIGPGRGREYPVVVRSPAGEAQGVMQFPFDELALENRLLHLQNALLRSGGQRRQVLSPEQEGVQAFGQNLFDAVMAGEVRICYEKSADRAQQQGKGLRVQLRIQPPEMATLPWEFMYDARLASYLALSPRTPITRYLSLARALDPVTIEPPLRILGMIANPQGVQPLDIQREKERLERAVGALQQSGVIELTWLPGETWRDLQRAMRNGRWHIFHFVGHGGFDTLADEGFVVLSDEQRQPHFLPATQLAELLTGYYPPRLVLLNACDGAQGGKRDIFSSSASILVRRGIPAVVAMQYEITDRAAIEFSHSFYEAVASGLSVETAMAEARKAIWISISNTFEWGTPVLYTHAPDGVLFHIQSRNAAQVTAQDAAAAGASRQETPEDSPARPREQEPPITHQKVEEAAVKPLPEARVKPPEARTTQQPTAPSAPAATRPAITTRERQKCAIVGGIVGAVVGVLVITTVPGTSWLACLFTGAGGAIAGAITGPRPRPIIEVLVGSILGWVILAALVGFDSMAVAIGAVFGAPAGAILVAVIGAILRKRKPS